MVLFMRVQNWYSIQTVTWPTGVTIHCEAAEFDLHNWKSAPCLYENLLNSIIIIVIIIQSYFSIHDPNKQYYQLNRLLETRGVS